MTVGERLRYVREHFKMTQEVVCEKLKKGKYFCEIDTTCLSRYEHDKRTQDLDFIKAFCDFFNVSSDWLICGEGDVFRVPQTRKDVKTVFLELSDLIKDVTLPQFKPPDYLPVDFEQMVEDTPEKFIHLLVYMLKDVQIRRHLFLNFYIFSAKSNQSMQD